MKKTVILTEQAISNIITDVLNEVIGGAKPTLNILWLDDVRSPEKYLASKKTSGAFLRNVDFYNRLQQKYNTQFTWVHNLNEFQRYVLQNGLPDLVSFDFDLGKGIEKGSECAKWLKVYCVKNNLKLPKYFVHSANNNGQKLIPTELGVETQLTEMVYVNALNGKKANLTYNTNLRNKDNKILKADTLSTDKMDQNNNKTNTVPLKGGLISYNITGINGTHVMHYFKKYFQHEKEKIKDDKGKEYELEMMTNEFNAFMARFKQKVWTVVGSCIEEFQKKDKDFQPIGISLYPVPSSSNFNIKMAEILNGGDINGLPVQVISQGLFVKDLRNLSIDNDFIEKNKKFYNGDKFQTPTEQNNGTYLQHTENDIKKQQKIAEMEKWIDLANDFYLQIYASYNNYLTALKNNKVGKGVLRGLIRNYKLFCDAKKIIARDAKYIDSITGDTQRINSTSIYQYIKGYKPASVEQRSDAIWKIVKPYLRGVISDVDGLPYTLEDIVQFQKIPFEIKKLSDAERMGMKNIYNPNTDEEFVRNEVEKTVNTVFVIFDDNISGGATLSDVCLQAKNLGIEHIIPITFGKMTKGSGGSMVPINTPINVNGERDYNF